MSLASRGHRGVLRLRRWRAIARIQLAARLAGAPLALHIDPTAAIGRIDVHVAPGVPSRLHVGAHTVLHDGVEIRLAGGSLVVGDWCEIRGGVRVMAAGDVEVVGQNLLSWGMVIHCDEAVVLARQSTFGEYVTISDSVHEHTDRGWHLDHIRTAPVHVGPNTWVGAKATITSGVTVGADCVVAGSAVVTKDVPDRHLALGIPATSRARSAEPV